MKQFWRSCQGVSYIPWNKIWPPWPLGQATTALQAQCTAIADPIDLLAKAGSWDMYMKMRTSETTPELIYNQKQAK